jgi:hypothetical protein
MDSNGRLAASRRMKELLCTTWQEAALVDPRQQPLARFHLTLRAPNSNSQTRPSSSARCRLLAASRQRFANVQMCSTPLAAGTAGALRGDVETADSQPLLAGGTSSHDTWVWCSASRPPFDSGCSYRHGQARMPRLPPPGLFIFDSPIRNPCSLPTGAKSPLYSCPQASIPIG